MPHINTLMQLYPDTAVRTTLLEQAVEHARTDLANLRNAISQGDHAAAQQQAHRAKGAVSFLGDSENLPAFDHLSNALKAQDPAGIRQAFAPVEAALLELEALLQQRLDTLRHAP